MIIHLAKPWNIGEQIGSGGFGRVFEASFNSEVAVAKLIPKSPGADRELLFSSISGIRNVVPVIDSGEIDGYFVLIMPRAEMSLQQRIEDTSKPLEFAEKLSILINIAESLADMSGVIIHRDIKPHNILFLDGKWCLADFGISKYAEASTETNTHKLAFSAPWCAPERWKLNSATSASDVYSFGIVAFQVLSGFLPFSCLTYEQCREQHLYGHAPSLSGLPSRLTALVEECLDKSPQARPSASSLLGRLQKAAEQPKSPGLAILQNVHLAEVQRQQVLSIEKEKALAEQEKKLLLLKSAERSFERIVRQLKEEIIDAAPSARARDTQGTGLIIQLGNAQLEIVRANQANKAPWQQFNPFVDVIAYSSVTIRVPPNSYGYQGRSHSLWYCDAAEEGKYQWQELAFMHTFSRERDGIVPFSLAPGVESGKALWNGTAEFQAAWPFTMLVDEKLTDFIDRWANWLAAAAAGTLSQPSVLPEKSGQGDWRPRSQ